MIKITRSSISGILHCHAREIHITKDPEFEAFGSFEGFKPFPSSRDICQSGTSLGGRIEQENATIGSFGLGSRYYIFESLVRVT